MRIALPNAFALLLVPAALLVAGCGGRVAATSLTGSASLAIQANTTQVDTGGKARFTANYQGEPAGVVWSVSGGDPVAGPGSISTQGVYTPPGYLTTDSARVTIRAVLDDVSLPGGRVSDAAQITLTPAFLQPLTPGNLSVGPGDSATISASITEVGGSGGIRFRLASDMAGTPSTAGTLSAPQCVRNAVKSSNPAYTVCSVTFTAPANLPASSSIYVVGSVGTNPTPSWTRVLLNSAGISSNPTTHQVRLTVPVELGSSSGSNTDYDATQGQVADCCGGTLGALLQDTGGTQYVLSNNHVLAHSDQSSPGETIIQPALIDNGCTPYGVGPGTTPVATLTGFPSLNSPTTNVDAAIARITPGAVDPRGSILELGTRQQDGTLAAAPPGISSTAGRGETPTLGMQVAKSGRTTGLTCASVSAINVDVVVDYFTDCAETTRAFSKTFTNQIAVAGTSFSDAGDSGALIVDTANAEPVGLFFAGGTDDHGVEHAIASPAGDVLTELDAQIPTANGSPTSYSFVGGADHPVSCVSYGGPLPAAESSASLSPVERARAEAAMPMAQSLLGSQNGVERVAITTSRDHPGQAAIAIYLDAPTNGTSSFIPTEIGGVSTVVMSNDSDAASSISKLRSASLRQALSVKQSYASTLFRLIPSLFGVGVGQSWDNPAEAALVLYVDRNKTTGKIPVTIERQRVRIVLMDRLHVTRSHGTPTHTTGGCYSSRHVRRSDETGTPPQDVELPLLEPTIELPK